MCATRDAEFATSRSQRVATSNLNQATLGDTLDKTGEFLGVDLAER